VSTVEREQRYIRYVLESIDRIKGYLPADYDAFLSDAEARDAVLWRLQTLADATKTRLSGELKARHRAIRWRDIAGFRNIAAHDYVAINLPLVWEIVSDHLGPLRDVMEQELR
jgi:uncharacterized protein with HEPN domain